MGRWYFTYKLGPERGSLFYNERPEVLGPEEPPPTTVPPQHTTPQTAVQSEPGAPLYNDFKHIQTDICSTISSSVPKLGRPLRSPPSGVGGGSCRFSTRARGVSPRGLDALEWLVGGEVAGEDGDGTHALIPCGVGIGVEVGVWVGVECVFVCVCVWRPWWRTPARSVVVEASVVQPAGRLQWSWPAKKRSRSISVCACPAPWVQCWANCCSPLANKSTSQLRINKRMPGHHVIFHTVIFHTVIFHTGIFHTGCQGDFFHNVGYPYCYNYPY